MIVGSAVETTVALVIATKSTSSRPESASGAFERDVAGVLLERSGSPSTPDAGRAARVQAAAFLTGLRVATSLWIEQPDVRPLVPTIDEVLDQIGGAFE